MAQRHEMTIDGELCVVWAGQRAPKRWRAYGDFRGTFIDVNEDSETAALRKWARKANHAANE
jgi:hypothetical protein